MPVRDKTTWIVLIVHSAQETDSTILAKNMRPVPREPVWTKKERITGICEMKAALAMNHDFRCLGAVASVVSWRTSTRINTSQILPKDALRCGPAPLISHAYSGPTLECKY